MNQAFTFIISNFVKGKQKIPKDFPKGFRIVHKVAEQLAQCRMKPVQNFQVCNHDMTSTHVHDGVRASDHKHDDWCLVSTTS